MALLALALQLGLSFGHVHVGAIKAPAAVALNITDHSPDGGKPQRGPHHPDDFCAICLVNGLIGSAQTAAPPAVPVPVSIAAAILPVTSEAAQAEQRRAAFRSRAPPLA